MLRYLEIYAIIFFKKLSLRLSAEWAELSFRIGRNSKHYRIQDKMFRLFQYRKWKLWSHPKSTKRQCNTFSKTKLQASISSALNLPCLWRPNVLFKILILKQETSSTFLYSDPCNCSNQIRKYIRNDNHISSVKFKVHFRTKYNWFNVFYLVHVKRMQEINQG